MSVDFCCFVHNKIYMPSFVTTFKMVPYMLWNGLIQQGACAIFLSLSIYI